MCPGPERVRPMTPLRPVWQRTLALRATAGGPSFLSAASGLVAAGDRLYVIADDELHLGVFPATGSRPGARVRLLPGRLPDDAAGRKAAKADFEVLVRLPRCAGAPRGGLLALGSGSRPGRRRAVLLPFDGTGRAGGARELDAAGFYRRLAAAFGELNVEGAAVAGGRLCLLNRGHPRDGGSAVAWLDLRRVLPRAGELAAPPVRARRVDLGAVDGVPLGFTDATGLPGGDVLFAAVAERAADSYQDGPCVGSAIGLLPAGGGRVKLWPVEPALKIEGIAFVPARGLKLVTDADDRTVPAALYALAWKPGAGRRL